MLSLFRKAQSQLTFMAASLPACIPENPSAFCTRAAGIQPRVPQQESPCAVCHSQVSCWSLPTSVSFSPPRREVRTGAHAGLPGSHRDCSACSGGSPALRRLCSHLPQLPISREGAQVHSQARPLTESRRQALSWKGRSCLQLLSYLWLREENGYSSWLRSPGVAGPVSEAR